MKRNLKQFYTYLCLLALIICPFHLSKVNTEMCPVGVSFSIEVELVPVCYFLTGCVFDYSKINVTDLMFYFHVATNNYYGFSYFWSQNPNRTEGPVQELYSFVSPRIRNIVLSRSLAKFSIFSLCFISCHFVNWCYDETVTFFLRNICSGKLKTLCIFRISVKYWWDLWDTWISCLGKYVSDLTWMFLQFCALADYGISLYLPYLGIWVSHLLLKKNFYWLDCEGVTAELWPEQCWRFAFMNCKWKWKKLFTWSDTIETNYSS